MAFNQPLDLKAFFFNPRLPCISDDATIFKKADAIVNGEFQYFSRFSCRFGFPPNWHTNPFSERSRRLDADFEALAVEHWSKIPDFLFGDIKCIWEIGRFSWVYPLIQAYQRTKNETYAQAIWDLISDWAKKKSSQSGSALEVRAGDRHSDVWCCDCLFCFGRRGINRP